VPRGRRLERIGEGERLADDLASAELHDANRVDWLLVVGDHVAGDPDVAVPEAAMFPFPHSSTMKRWIKALVSSLLNECSCTCAYTRSRHSN